jgi:hypothetical protein
MFREYSQKYFTPLSLWIMVFGVVALCQPWFEKLHTSSVLIMLGGIICFNIFPNIKPKVKIEEDE